MGRSTCGTICALATADIDVQATMVIAPNHSGVIRSMDILIASLSGPRKCDDWISRTRLRCVVTSDESGNITACRCHVRARGSIGARCRHESLVELAKVVHRLRANVRQSLLVTRQIQQDIQCCPLRRTQDGTLG